MYISSTTIWLLYVYCLITKRWTRLHYLDYRTTPTLASLCKNLKSSRADQSLPYLKFNNGCVLLLFSVDTRSQNNNEYDDVCNINIRVYIESLYITESWNRIPSLTDHSNFLLILNSYTNSRLMIWLQDVVNAYTTKLKTSFLSRIIFKTIYAVLAWNIPKCVEKASSVKLFCLITFWRNGGKERS